MSFLKKHIIIVTLLFIFTLDAQEYTIHNLTAKDGLPSNIVYDIQQDKIGYLWIATEKGLVKYDGDNFISIHKQKTTTIFIDDKTIYTGLENGLFIQKKTKSKFLKSKKVLTIFKYVNNIFVGTIEGIYCLKNDKLELLNINTVINSASINDVKTNKKGIIISSSKGLFKSRKKLNNNSLKKIKTGNFRAIENSYKYFITTENNNLISIFKGDTVHKRITSLSDIYTIKKLKNEIWVTSNSNGIEVFSLPSFSFKQKINKYNSLNTNTIYNVFIDSQNTTYIGSDKGLFILRKSKFQNNATPKPKVYFENLQVNHKNNDSLLSLKKVKLSNTENNIAISFKTVYISNPKSIRYRYKMKGEFSPWSTSNTVQFPNLNAGRYNFQVQSKIGNQKSKVASLNFTIDAPFYTKDWFILSIIILTLTTGYLILHFYLKKVNAINKQKVDKLKFQNKMLSLEQKALQLQMNPHFIFNVLNGIKALGNNGDKKELNNTISKFSVLLRGILSNSRKDEITLQDEINLLKNYIELEQRMNTNSFNYTITTNLNNIDTEEILIPTMLIQPFVENCIQHAFKKNNLGKIKINFDVKYRFLNCSIRDNGIGIQQSKLRKTNKAHKSVALKVSKERLLTIDKNSKFEIKEIVDNNKIKGTEVTFKIPLKTDF